MRPFWAFLFLFSFAVFTAAFNVSSSAPADLYLSASSNVTFSYSIDANVTSCSLYANASGWTSLVTASNGSSFSHNFTADGSYVWAVACSDGNQTFFSANRSLRIDTIAPSVPGNLSASGHTPVNLSWAASTDASSVTYELLRNGTQVFNGGALVFSENIPASTTYNYSLRAIDAAGFGSGFTNVSVSGPAPSLTLSNFTVSPSASGATFSWIPSVASNASVSYGNATAVVGIVANPSLSSSPSLAVAGLQPATSYSYNATACASTCTVVTGNFLTLPSSYPTPSQIGANGTAANTVVRFSALWSDSLNLSYYVFSTNASGSWANATYAFNGSYSNHSFTLPSSAVTVAWLFYANNSQGGMNKTAQQNLTVVVPITATPTPVPTVTPTPVPTATPVPIVTPVPTVPPELVQSTPTPTPAPAASVAPVATAAPSANEPLLNSTVAGGMSDVILDAPDADFALSPTGLVIGVQSSKATVVFSSNFTNRGDNVTVLLRAELNATDADNATVTLVLSSLPTDLESNQTALLQTVPTAVPPGAYHLTAQVLDSATGRVLDSRTLQIQVKSASTTGYATQNASPALFGFWVVLMGVSALVLGQLSSLKKEFH